MKCLYTVYLPYFAFVILSVVEFVEVRLQWNSTNQLDATISWSPDCTSAPGKIPRLIPHPWKCRTLFICAKGRPQEYSCPDSEVFDAELQECKKWTTCKKASKELPAFESCPEVDDGKNGLLPHPTDCHMYYQCVHGTAYPRPCPKDLHFNPELKVCDWPENANCKSRFLILKS